MCLARLGATELRNDVTEPPAGRRSDAKPPGLFLYGPGGTGASGLTSGDRGAFARASRCLVHRVFGPGSAAEDAAHIRTRSRGSRR